MQTSLEAQAKKLEGKHRTDWFGFVNLQTIVLSLHQEQTNQLKMIRI